ncbi:MAG: cysteine--tRNA ligase [Planctomycetota bacterium]|nr:MAG: cysteine--tRNA ligase [Planctomycetota bacterium]REJ91437.1 MAG: cysteine--tRNA ligase [Planctomycetota bacterium]REK18539.1 MAG: cysteine--tRNA ligase [Planctomycetota bacterium]REK39510.1 MAG: cysteine--tRNA ligase [Planctomycetota bacterium]
MSTTMSAAQATADATGRPTIQVYNSLTRSKAPLEPVTPGHVGIYLCGPTVYDKAHIGHMVGPVIFDTIKRYLTYCGYQVTWVVNVTDVDDKLIKRSAERGISMSQLAEEMTQDYLDNLAGMGVDGIDHMPKATESMDAIIAFTAGLIDKGFAYEVEGDVFFDVAKDPQYGKLTNRSVDELQGEGGGAAAKKRSAADFALWKAAKQGEPAWESPWGAGRPGWHIECSAMSKLLLGETFDIHGGGLDLVFPHHENEVAQSECLHGAPMAKVWMHNGLLRASAAAGKVGGRAEREAGEAGDQGAADDAGADIAAATAQKMSRSKGAGGLADQIAKFGGEKIRFCLLRTHYRSTVLFGEEALEESGTGLETFYRFFKRFERVTGGSFYELAPATTRAAGAFDAGDDALLATVADCRQRFLAAMDDDFNTGSAIGDLFELVRTLNKFVDQENLEGAGKSDAAKLATLTQGATTLRELAGILGLFRAPVDAGGGASDELVGKLMELFIELRTAARKNKDFAMADKIRDDLANLGVTLEDRPDGTDWTIG